MIVKKLEDHIVNTSPTCGIIRGILGAADYPSVNVAIAIDIQPTTAHFHESFDEIYFVLDGELELALYDPKTDSRTSVTLGPNELCVITRGIHHVVVKATEHNRLCALTIPGFNPEDENPSDKL